VFCEDYIFVVSVSWWSFKKESFTPSYPPMASAVNRTVRFKLKNSCLKWVLTPWIPTQSLTNLPSQLSKLDLTGKKAPIKTFNPTWIKTKACYRHEETSSYFQCFSSKYPQSSHPKKMPSKLLKEKFEELCRKFLCCNCLYWSQMPANSWDLKINLFVPKTASSPIRFFETESEKENPGLDGLELK